jgi:hypothetical protein
MFYFSSAGMEIWIVLSILIGAQRLRVLTAPLGAPVLPLFLRGLAYANSFPTLASRFAVRIPPALRSPKPGIGSAAPANADLM